jgi:hypothetical protein
MTTFPNTTEEQLSQLLGCTIEQLDISPQDYLAAERRYTDVGAYLSDDGADVYVQGSIRLGTVVAPYGRSGEYDLDLVCLVDEEAARITKQELKQKVGDLLQDYIDDDTCIDGEIPDLGEGRRSWKLGYKRFHMDVLPAIPDPDAVSGTGIKLTDKQLVRWQSSDPVEYARWFRGQCATIFEAERKQIAKAAGTLEPVPDWQIRTPLHRVVQILKRHRDIFFESDEDDRPPSSLITTLAGLSYAGEIDLMAATILAVERMPDHVEDRNGVLWVPNPACEEENFADKWADYPLRQRKFERWRKAVLEDLRGVQHEDAGLPAVHARLAKAFGADEVKAAVSKLGEDTRDLLREGELKVSRTTGALVTGAGLGIARHGFYGDPTKT